MPIHSQVQSTKQKSKHIQQTTNTNLETSQSTQALRPSLSAKEYLVKHNIEATLQDLLNRIARSTPESPFKVLASTLPHDTDTLGRSTIPCIDPKVEPAFEKMRFAAVSMLS